MYNTRPNKSIINNNMSYFPENYTQINTHPPELMEDHPNYPALIQHYQEAIRAQFSENIPPEMFDISTHHHIYGAYIVELLARLNTHLESKGQDEANAEQLHLLLNDHAINIWLYRIAIAVLVLLAVIVAAGAATLAWTCGSVSFFALTALALLAFNEALGELSVEHDLSTLAVGIAMGISLVTFCWAPGLFLLTTAAFSATFALLMKISTEVSYGTDCISFYTNTSNLRSDAVALMNIGVFSTENNVVAADANDDDDDNLSHTSVSSEYS